MTDSTSAMEFIKNRIEEQTIRRFRTCTCECKCRARHLFGDVCALCRDGDHWTSLAAYLDKIQARQDERA